MILAGIHFVLSVAWLGLFVIAINRVRPWIESPAVRRGLDAAVGLCLLALGLALVVA